ncbi:MAG: PAS domain S-box protein [Patescibacteria group bacterium]|jgi:two-component system CheB/CheR fusion protein
MRIREKNQPELSMEEALEYAEGIVQTVREPLIVLNADLKVISANKSFYKIFKVDPKHTEGQFIYNLGNRQWNIPKLRELLTSIISKNNSFTNFEVAHKFEDIGEKIMLLNARRIPRLPKKPRILLLAIEDITALRRVEQEKRASEYRYYSLFVASRDAIMTIDPPNWKFTSGNPATLKMFRAKSEAVFLSYDPWKLSPKFQPDGQVSSKKAKEMINIALRKGSNYFEWVHKRINGQEFFASVLLSRGEQYGRPFLHALVRDITEQKNVELALKTSEERFKNIFDKAGDGIILAEKGSKKFFIGNNAIQNMLGYSAKEISNLKVNDIHPKKDLPYVLGQFRRQAKGDFTLARNLPVLRKNGSVFYADVNATIVKMHGKTYLMGFFHDNTEHIRLEKIIEDIRKSQEKTILAAIGDGVMACDAKGKIIVFNEIASQFTGFSSQEAIGQHYKKILNIIREDTKKFGIDFIDQAMKKGKMSSLTNHMMIIKKDGTRIPVADSASPFFNDAGKVIGCVVVFRDVTKEREIDKAKTEFVSLASHQLRTPLASINWLTEMLLEGDFGATTHKQKENIKMIYKSVQRMSDLIRNLLNISRLELGTFTVNNKQVILSRTVDELLVDLASFIEAKHIIIKKDYSAKLSVINADPLLLKIILQNLITNAVHYTLPRTIITVKIRKSKEEFLLSIKDHGVGIPTEDQPKIFTKFFRASNAQKMSTEGTGLGLYIAKSILDATGSRIWFNSILGKGTTFFVAFPLRGMKPKKGSKNLEVINYLS